MGQARNVLVYRLLCTNTIDEKITELLEYKQEIFDAFADESVAAERNESGNVEVDEKKFGQIIQEEIDRINAEKGKCGSANLE
jgi:SNF2 family DNA or RNA helicase